MYTKRPVTAIVDRHRAFRTWLRWAEIECGGSVDLAQFDAVLAVRRRLYPYETQRDLIALLHEAAGLHVVDVDGEQHVVAEESLKDMQREEITTWVAGLGPAPKGGVTLQWLAERWLLEHPNQACPLSTLAFIARKNAEGRGVSPEGWILLPEDWP